MKRAPPPASDNFLRYAVITALLVVVVGFASAWIYFNSKPEAPPFAYSDFGPIIVRTSQYSLKTKLSLQTSDDNVSWVKDHRAQMTAVMEKFMATLDFDRVRAPGGLTYVQDVLRDAANSEFHTDNVQNILLTDFIIQSN